MEEQKYVVLMPVFNDWDACQKVLVTLDQVFCESRLAVAILLINDGSTVPITANLARQTFRCLDRVDILELKRNLGHQRAISVGLAYIEAHVPCAAVIIMDGDGEDNPADVPKLLDKYEQEYRSKIVFAERVRRSEHWTFRVFYTLYKILNRVLTGHQVRVGNFSVVPYVRLRSLVVVPELWNHYAAAVFNSRQPYCSVPTARARRVGGTSKMNFVSLIIHGLSAISVFSETVGVRLLLMTLSLVAFALGGMACVVVIRLFTDLAIPGWATFTTGLLAVIILQAIMLAINFSFLILSSRKDMGFLPARDYVYFIGGLRNIAGKQ
jgi:polyisoprenyl-phosphate glycosyltransferase